MRECAVPTCPTLTRYPDRFCAAHWRLLPHDLQQAMLTAQHALSMAWIAYEDFADIEAEAVAAITVDPPSHNPPARPA